MNRMARMHDAPGGFSATVSAASWVEIGKPDAVGATARTARVKRINVALSVPPRGNS